MSSGRSRTPSTGGAPARSRIAEGKRLAVLVLIVLVAIWLIAFIVSNSKSVKVSFVFGDVTLSLIWVMILCAVLGAFLAWAIPRFRRRR